LGLAPVAFARQFAGDPRALVYELAKKYEASGDRTLAETAAEKALGFEDGSARADQRGHYLCAEQLRMEGHFAWAEREYRRVTRSGNLDDLNVIDAYENLALMLHDRGENLRAAETLEQFAKAIKRSGGDAKVEDKNRAAMTAELNKYIVARMDYYQACHWRDAGDRTRQRLAIEAGLIQDPEGADLLIEAFKLPDADPIFREKIRKRIKNVALQLRMRVVTGSDPANACNELAWLIANTEGDLDEAIRLSRRSVDEQPENGAYYDTLARCYFAKGDHAKAVENQIKAFELEPHSGLIAKQLDEFRRAYEKKFGKPAPKPGPPRKKTPPAPQSLQQSVSPLLDYEQFGP
ncbi:MAG TPA: hypothetical protein VJL29_14835, partial [Thermoguttaceae bacterium]|nr:hypothetical protein [Thermoguttaceae bacterium]